MIAQLLVDETLKIEDIAEACGLSRRHAHRRAVRERWERVSLPGRAHAYGYLAGRLPVDVQAALLVKRGSPPTPARDETREIELWRQFERRPASIQAKAKHRLDVLLDVRALIAAGAKKLAAVKAIARRSGEHQSTIRKWQKLVVGLDRGDWLPALAPANFGRTKTAECSIEAWNTFTSDYLRPSRPRAEACYRRVMEAAAVNGWTVPTLPTLLRKLKREVPPASIVWARDGEEALKRSMPAQRRDHTVFSALEAVNGDGHLFDVFCHDKQGRKFRPWLLAWQDIYSGKWLSWRVGYVECAEIIRLSFGDLCRTYGRPVDAFLDNGRGFASKWNTGGIPNRHRFKFKPDDEPDGVFKLLGVTVHWTLPYSGQSKPIERGFQDVAEEISKHPLCDGAYTGNRPDAKPENYGNRTVPFDDFLKLVDDRMRAINARGGRRSPACNGRSFDETFAESYRTTPIRKVKEEQLRLLLLTGENVTARKDTAEIHLYGNVYWSPSPAIMAMEGRKVTVRFDPQNLHQPIHVYDGPRYLGPAECQQIAGFNKTEDAKAIARERKRYMRTEKELARSARTMTALELAARYPQAPATELPEAKVIRPLGFAPKPPQQCGMTQAERDAALSSFVQRVKGG